MLPAVSLKRTLPAFFSRAGNATASISMTEPTNPATPNPKMRPTTASFVAFFVTNCESRDTCATSKTSVLVTRTGISPSRVVKARLYASAKMFIALRPSIVYSAISSFTPSSNSTPSFFDAFTTISSKWAGINGSKYISAHRERSAGFMCRASRVVAPMSTKSAGAPSSNNFFMYGGVRGSVGS